MLFNFYFLKNSFKFKITFETVKLELVTILNRNNHSFLEAKIENFWIISNFLKSIFINSFLIKKSKNSDFNKYFFPYFLHYFSFNHEETRKSSRLLNNSTSQEQHYITLNYFTYLQGLVHQCWQEWQGLQGQELRAQPMDCYQVCPSVTTTNKIQRSTKTHVAGWG